MTQEPPPNADPSHPAGAPARARILIVDDHPAVREALAIRIGQQPDMIVCGEAADAPEALRLLDVEHPDLAIVDITLRTSDGLDLIKRIKAHDPRVRLLVWSMHSESLYAGRALRAGAHGYITKEQATIQIVEAVRRVLEGKVYLSPAMTEKLLSRSVGKGEQPSLAASPVDVLSDRELEVLRLIGQGARTADVAQRLRLSVKTVETYRDRIRQKLDLVHGADLARFAMQWVLEQE